MCSVISRLRKFLDCAEHIYVYPGSGSVGVCSLCVCTRGQDRLVCSCTQEIERLQGVLKMQKAEVAKLQANREKSVSF